MMQLGAVQLHHGDCREVLRTLPADSVDAVVTDPPYGLEFMGKEWDRLGDIGKISHAGIPERDGSSVFGRAARVNYNGSSNVRCRNCNKWKWGHKPGDGGGGGKRCTCDAPDFPSTKAQQAPIIQAWHEEWAHEVYRVMKPGAHAVIFGGTRTWHRLAVAVEDAGFELRDTCMWMYGTGFPKSHNIGKAIDRMAGVEREVVGTHHFAARKPNGTWTGEVYGDEPGHGQGPALTAPATPEAAAWEGWGTALKPSWEPALIFRKPLSEPTVAANVLKWSTGALNIDAARVPTEESTRRRNFSEMGYHGNNASRDYETGSDHGRWPANLCHDSSPEVLAAFDLFDGGRREGWYSGEPQRGIGYGSGVQSRADGSKKARGTGDAGNAARFFYSAKAGKADRAGSSHPTVKPISLMRWLVRMVTPPGGTVLDCFAGSGTTGAAAVAEGFQAILVEQDATYCADIVRRLGGQQVELAEAGPLFNARVA